MHDHLGPCLHLQDSSLEIQRVISATQTMRALLRARFLGDTHDIHKEGGAEAAQCPSWLAEEDRQVGRPWRITLIERRAPASRRFQQVDTILQVCFLSPGWRPGVKLIFMLFAPRSLFCMHAAAILPKNFRNNARNFGT